MSNILKNSSGNLFSWLNQTLIYRNHLVSKTDKILQNKKSATLSKNTLSCGFSVDVKNHSTSIGSETFVLRPILITVPL